MGAFECTTLAFEKKSDDIVGAICGG